LINRRKWKDYELAKSSFVFYSQKEDSSLKPFCIPCSSLKLLRSQILWDLWGLYFVHLTSILNFLQHGLRQYILQFCACSCKNLNLHFSEFPCARWEHSQSLMMMSPLGTIFHIRDSDNEMKLAALCINLQISYSHWHW